MLVRAEAESDSEVETVDQSNESSNEDVYTVKRIVAENKRKFLIHWEGWDAEKNFTWEPKENISHMGDVLEQWRKDKKREKSLKKWKELIQNAEESIVVENDVDEEGPPADFQWTEHLVYRTKAPNIERVISCECSDGICGPDCSCVKATNDANGTVENSNYDETGRLVRKGFRGGIYECNYNCECAGSCSNRVAQNGRKIPLVIFKTEEKGWGVKTPRALRPGTFITKYVGEMITSDEANEREAKNGNSYLFDVDFHSDTVDENVFTVDGRNYGNVGRFLNHSCDPNCIIVPVAIDTSDPEYYYLSMFAKRRIKAGEELTIDYSGGGLAGNEGSESEEGEEEAGEVEAVVLIPDDDEEDEDYGAGPSRPSRRASGGSRPKRPRPGQDGTKRKRHRATDGNGEKGKGLAAHVNGNGHRRGNGLRNACYCGAAKCFGIVPFSTT
ncbi:hypothetical protein HDV00_010497 [Rhizophlyctis rosea]|nr:hypothetical protein HDV00_010497 [Rhizophlyctis rosea]